ncbi:hypothetical protein AAC387_Pa06g0230 [Persea americana]
MQILTLKNDRMKSKDPLAPPYHERRIPMTIILTVLCGFSFYLGGIFISMKKLHTMDVSQAVQLPKEVTSASLQVQPIDFPEFNSDYQDYTPFTDPKRWKKYDVHKLSFMELHCPSIFERKECPVPPPVDYRPPIRWPKSRDECWYRWNLPSRDTPYTPTRRLLGPLWPTSEPYKNRWQGWNRMVEELESNYEKLQKMLASMCFILYNQKDDIAVWQKSSDNSCYDEHINLISTL